MSFFVFVFPTPIPVHGGCSWFLLPEVLNRQVPPHPSPMHGGTGGGIPTTAVVLSARM